MDRTYAEPLDVPALARIACASEAHFIRTFRATFGETPHRYLQRRRVERAMWLLRETDQSVTSICFDVGFTSLGTFSRTFREIVGQSPVAYRRDSAPAPGAVPRGVRRQAVPGRGAYTSARRRGHQRRTRDVGNRGDRVLRIRPGEDPGGPRDPVPTGGRRARLPLPRPAAHHAVRRRAAAAQD